MRLLCILLLMVASQFAFGADSEVGYNGLELLKHSESKLGAQSAKAANIRLSKQISDHFKNIHVAPDISKLYHQRVEEVEASVHSLASWSAEPPALAARHMSPQKKSRRQFLIPQKLAALATAEEKRRASKTIHQQHEDAEEAYSGTSSAVDPQHTSHVRSFFASASVDPSTLEACTFCENGDFISTAVLAEDECELPLQQLQAGIFIAASDAEVDYIWSMFCSSKCFLAMAKIDPRYYCCLETTELAFLNVLTACQPSPQHHSRYCGAEMSNMLVVGCNHTNASSCLANSRTCEWDEESGICLFRASQANLEHICTDCNRQYFEKFPVGGMFNLTMHAYLAGVFGAFCNQVQDKFCYLTSADMGYRMAQTAEPEDLDGMCAANTNSHEQLLCHRITAVRASEASRRKGLEDWKFCNISEDAYTECDLDSASAFLIGRAMEKSAMLACSYDPSNNAICPKVAYEQMHSNSDCFNEIFDNAMCPASCDSTVKSATDNMGCCGPVFGQGGFEMASKAPISTRLIIGSTALGLSYINNQSWMPVEGVNRAARTNYEFTMMESNVNRLVNGNALAGIANCSSMFNDFATWAYNISQCIMVPARRTYYLKLNLNFEKLKNCVNKDYVYSAITSDIAAVTGITRPQIVQTYVTAEDSINVAMRGSQTRAPGLLMIYTLTSDAADINTLMDENIKTAKSKGRFIFPTAGIEAILNCPGVMPDTQTAIFSDMYAVLVAGDTPVVVTSGCSNRLCFMSLVILVLLTYLGQ